jgi:hypothetical protein
LFNLSPSFLHCLFLRILNFFFFFSLLSSLFFLLFSQFL